MTEHDDRLLAAALAEALAPEPVPPNPDDLTRLHQALAIRTNGHGAFREASAPVPTVRRFALPSWTVQVRRLRHPVAVLAVVGVLATGGVATAAVATNTLPGPSRDVAFDLGLPVSSPDLVATQACIGALRTALDSRDAAEVSTEANSLRRDLAALSPTELRQVVLEANQLLAQSSDFLDAAAAAARGGSGTAADQAHASGSAPAQPETAPSSQSLEGGSSGSGGDDGSAGSTSVSGGSDDSGGSSDGGTSVSGGNDDGGGSGTDGGTSVSGGGSGSGTDGGTAVLGGGSGSGTDGGTSVSGGGSGSGTDGGTTMSGGGSGSGTDGGTSVSGGGSGSDGSSDGGTSISGG